MRVENRTMGRLDVRLETRDIDGVYFNSSIDLMNEHSSGEKLFDFKGDFVIWNSA